MSVRCILGWLATGFGASVVSAYLAPLTTSVLGWAAALWVYGALILVIAVGAYGRGRRQLGYYGMGVVMSYPFLLVVLVYLLSHWTVPW